MNNLDQEPEIAGGAAVEETETPSPAEIETQRSDEVNQLLDRTGVDRTAVENASDKFACVNVGCPELGVEYTRPFLTATPAGPACATCKGPALQPGGPAPAAAAATVPAPASETQLSMITFLGQTKRIDVVLECRKQMQCEIDELGEIDAGIFIGNLQKMPVNMSPPAPPAVTRECSKHGKHEFDAEAASFAGCRQCLLNHNMDKAMLDTPAETPPTHGSVSDADRRKAAGVAAEVNTGDAARATASGLVPEMGNVLAAREPTALAYGFPPAVDALIVKAKLSPEQTQDLLSKFGNLFAQIDGWRGQVEGIVIKDENDDENIAKAKEIAATLAADRINVEKRKKLIKEPYLRPSQLIDGVFKIYIDEARPIEQLALQKAKTKEIAEQARKEKLRAEREAQLAPYVENVKAFDLLTMNDEAFEILLSGQKELFEARQAQQMRENE